MPNEPEGLAQAYLQDVIAPAALVHGLDYGDSDPAQPGVFGHVYNFLDYLFEADGERILARHYLDEPGRVLVMGHLDTATPGAERVLVFLAMRYDEIALLCEEGYRPWDDALKSRILGLAEAHMQAAATP